MATVQTETLQSTLSKVRKTHQMAMCGLMVATPFTVDQCVSFVWCDYGAHKQNGDSPLLQLSNSVGDDRILNLVLRCPVIGFQV